MFSLKVVDTDTFLDMSPSAQNLYFHLGMRADDDGFVASPKKIMVMVNASEDDMKVLIAKNFVIKMATNGVSVITHWHTNNLIRPDRYQETDYKEEKSRLEITGGKYTQSFGIPNVIPDGNQMAPQYRLGKVRLGKVTDMAADGFENLWVEYPIKVKKAKAKESWLKITPQDQALCLPAIKNQMAHFHFRGKDGVDYIPHLTTWLNQRRWEDQVEIKKNDVNVKNYG